MNKNTKTAIGLMSGTSMDAIDAALVKIDDDFNFEFIKGHSLKYPSEVRQKLLEIANNKATTSDICFMDFVCAKLFARCALELITKNGLQAGDIDYIASHGQTVFHIPEDKTISNITAKSTLQIANISTISELTGITTIGDFRSKDIAAGGQGAPLVPFADELIFKKDKNRAIQNIGGIGNVTVLSKDCDTFAFDTGPGNMLIDGAVKKLFDLPFDKDGQIAAKGKIDEKFLNELLDEDAVEASDALELTLTGRSVPDRPTRVPMCGFPYHTLDKYLQKLQDKGFKIVIGEEDKDFPIKEKAKANQNYSDVEIAEILPADGKEILRLYEYRFSDDRFYVDEEKGEVTWLYFNPDSTAGGQFVENVVSIEQIIALKDNEDYSVFFDKLGSEARQFLIDVGDENFHDVAKRFLSDEYYYHGFGTEAREELISIAEELEQVEKPRLKGEFTHSFSLRLLPFEGGVQGIFDNVTGKFIGSNGEIFRYAEHSEALKDLNGFQRVNGFAEANIFTTENGKEYHEGDTLYASFEGKDGVHLEIERIDEHDVWYTMPSEPGQEAVSMDRYEFEKYLDKGNISLLFSRYPILNDDRTPEERAADRAEEAELTAVSRFLRATKMDDIDLHFDVGEIVARDGSNEWRGKEFYEFLLNDAIALDENLDPVEGMSIDDETLNPVIELAQKYGAHIERVPSREPTELEVAKKLIEDYCAEEYNSESVDFSDLTNIGIGYTTITDDEIPIQVVVNLVDFKIEKYLADDIVEVSKYDSLHDLIEHELRDLNFTALISVSDNLIEQYNEKYGTGIPQLVGV